MSLHTAPLPAILPAPEPRRFWRKLARVLAIIPFAEDLVAGYLCAFDHTTPSHVRAVLLGAAAYFVLPADLVPDVLAGIGFTDDAAVLTAALTAIGRHLRPEHRAEARRRLAELRRAG